MQATVFSEPSKQTEKEQDEKDRNRYFDVPALFYTSSKPNGHAPCLLGEPPR